MIQDATSPFTRQPVQLFRLREEFQDHAESGSSGVEVWPLGLLKLPLQSCALVPHTAETLSDLVSRPLGIAHQVEVLPFLVIELGHLLLNRVAPLLVDLRIGRNGEIHGFRDALPHAGGEGDRRVDPAAEGVRVCGESEDGSRYGTDEDDDRP
ncbi:hypothetical protein [Actinomadura mexicana]|uniref:hypothetical protein n=1 Tax=Actinomadura mexicana TaxID=134959 RepID=UPI000B78F214|nr:hypothetical protein [Actinomadura mexicana]